MKTIIAWWLISLTWYSRPMYDLLGKRYSLRAYRGTNPLRTMLDGLLMVLIGVLVTLIPIVGVLTLPFTSLWLYFAERESFNSTRDLVRAGRISWRDGTVLGPDKEKTDGQA